MLYLTTGTVLYSVIHWLGRLVRCQRYATIMNRLLQRVSVVVRSNKQKDRARGLANVWTLGAEQVELEDRYVIVSSADKLHEIDLSSWCCSHRSTVKSSHSLKDTIYVLLEAVKRDESAEAKAPCCISSHAFLFGQPVAWTSDDTYSLILRCQQSNLISLIDAFGQGELTLVKGMDLHQLLTVKLVGTPQEVVRKADFYLSRENSLDESSSQNQEIQDQSDTTELGKASQKSSTLNVQYNNASSIDSTNYNELSEIGSEFTKQSSVGHKVSDLKVNDSQSAAGTMSEAASKVDDFSKPSSHDDMVSKNSGPQESGSSQNFSKPPNVLVYCGLKDTERKFQQVKSSLEACINKDAYTIYNLSHDSLLTHPWGDNAILLIISFCPQLRTEAENVIKDYVTQKGGKIISFNSSIDSHFAQRKEVSNRVGDGLCTFQTQDSKTVTSVSGRYVFSQCDERDSKVLVPYFEKLASENDETGAQSVTAASNAFVVKTEIEGGGAAVLSQLLLERDPAEYAMDQSTFDALKASNSDRIAILKDILTSLGIDTSIGHIPALTHCNMLARRVGLKDTLYNTIQHRLKSDGLLKSRTLSLQFTKDLSDLPEATPTVLPVTMVEDSDLGTSLFDTSEYWQNLKTATLGQLVFYTDVITSTMNVFDGLLFSIPEDVGVIAIAGRQTSGKGRGGNVWLSPVGCAMFTLPLSMSVDSELGQRISFLQHMVSLAVVQSVVSIPGYEDLELRLKWPNDIYYSNKMKLGGVLVTSTLLDDTIYATIGCGFNVTNSNPTICINDIIRLHNTSHPDRPPLKLLTTSQLIGRTVTALEELINLFNSKGQQAFCQEYYKHWLHSGAKVKVQLDIKTEGEIQGLDSYGYLEVKTSSGQMISVQPDGNSFDMMHNLICFKT